MKTLLFKLKTKLIFKTTLIVEYQIFRRIFLFNDLFNLDLNLKKQLKLKKVTLRAAYIFEIRKVDNPITGKILLPSLNYKLRRHI